MNMLRAVRYFGLSFLVALSASCRQVLSPDDLDREGLDGSWALTTINGSPLSSYTPGFPLPQRSDFLRTGSLYFSTRLAWGGGSTDVEESLHEGTAIGAYELVNAQGAATAPETKAGDFEYDLESELVTLRALGSSITGQRSGQTITFTQQDVPILGVVTLVFTKSAN
jgi:hypothetical protein